MTAVEKDDLKSLQILLLAGADTTQTDKENRIAPIGELSLNVGPDGGYAHRGDLSLFVPAGAVDEEVTLLAKVYIDKQVFPPVDISKEEFIFSPVLSLEPHGYQFKEQVLVRFPFSAVPGGWHLYLLRTDCGVEEVVRTWKQIIRYYTDTGELTTEDCEYDVDHALLAVTHFCHHCWGGKPNSYLNQGISYFNRRKLLYCSVFGQPNGSLNKWHLELNLHDRCDDIFESVDDSYKRTDQPWKLFASKKVLTVAGLGEIKCEVNLKIGK
jgi:hypothetical protein